MFANLSKKISLFSLLASFCLPVFAEARYKEDKNYSKELASNVTPQKRETGRMRKARYQSSTRKTSPEPHVSTPWKKLTTGQLEDKLVYAKNIFDDELTLKILQQLAKTAHLNSKLNTYLLQLADFYFERSQLDKASEYYVSYCTLFPGSKESEYAAYKGVLASFYTTLAPNRDITPTERTIELGTKFLKQVVRKDYKSEVEKILVDCNQKLFQHEVYVFEHYVQQKKYKPAQMRLDYIAKHFLSTIADAKRLMPHLKELLAQAENPVTRPFIINVNWDYDGAQIIKKKIKHQNTRHVNRIKV